jgi:hypothetical protein
VELGEFMGALARQYSHIDMWGGCCGTWDRHLDETARNVSMARNVGAFSPAAADARRAGDEG